MTNLYKGDDTGAFGNNFITINLDNPQEFVVTKAIFTCGCIQKTFDNPQFPIVINLSGKETERLRTQNVCYLVAYDSQGRQRTCKGTLTFNAKNGVLTNVRRTCC